MASVIADPPLCEWCEAEQTEPLEGFVVELEDDEERERWFCSNDCFVASL